MLDMSRISSVNVLLVFLMLVSSAICARGDGMPHAAAAPSLSSHPQSFSTCLNDPGRPLKVNASGVAPLRYSWEQKRTTGPWTEIDGATSSSFTPPTRQAATTCYRVRVNGSDGSSRTTKDTTCTIYRPP